MIELQNIEKWLLQVSMLKKPFSSSVMARQNKLGFLYLSLLPIPKFWSKAMDCQVSEYP
jgi:hypothetical protein